MIHRRRTTNSDCISRLHAACRLRSLVRVVLQPNMAATGGARPPDAPRMSTTPNHASTRHLTRNPAIESIHPVPEPGGTREQNVGEQYGRKRDCERCCVHEDDQQGQNQTVGETHDDLRVGKVQDAGGIPGNSCAGRGLFDCRAGRRREDLTQPPGTRDRVPHPALNLRQDRNRAGSVPIPRAVRNAAIMTSAIAGAVGGGNWRLETPLTPSAMHGRSGRYVAGHAASDRKRGTCGHHRCLSERTRRVGSGFRHPHAGSTGQRRR